VVLRTPYPTFIARPRAVTEGARLARYEGPSYRLRPLRVVTARGPVRAQAWMAQRWRAAAPAWVA
jgi:hypothetical protein